MERWKQIEGFPDYYISNQGRVKSFKRYGTDERILSPVKNRGYSLINLRKNGKIHHRYIHRLVALYFISSPIDGQQINHKNGIKSDNRVENLEWCTPSENCRHALKNGLRANTGEKSKSHKLTKDQVIEIRRRYKEEDVLQKELAKEYGVVQQNISQIVNNKKWNYI